MAATLRIGVEGGRDVARALGEIAAVGRRANATLSSEERRASTERMTLMRTEMQQVGAMERLKVELTARAERERANLMTRLGAARIAAEAAVANAGTREEAKRTRIAEQEARRREDIAKREADKAVRQEERKAVAAERASARRIAAAGREGRQFGRDRGGDLVNGAGQVHQMYQSARAARAGSEHNLNAALYQAGATQAEVGSAQAQINAFVTTGAGRGMSHEAVTGAILAGQTEFNSIGSAGDTPAQRQAGLDRSLRVLALARNTYQDPGEMLRLSGMMANVGVTGDENMRVLMATSAVAQHGSAEARDLIGQGGAGLQRRMQLAAELETRRHGAGWAETAEGTSTLGRTRATAAIQAMGEIEAAKAAGWSVGNASNVGANFSQRLQGDRIQEQMWTRMQHEGAHDEHIRAAQGTMFTTDAHGHHHLTDTSMIGIAHQLNAAGVDSISAQNMLAAGIGHGQTQAGLANERRLLGTYMSHSGAIADIVNSAGTFGATDEHRGEDIVNHESQTAIQSNEETRNNALTENTGALGSLSNAISSWASSNPFGAAFVASITGPLVSSIGGSVGGAAATAFAAARAGGAGILGATGAGAGAALAPLGAGVAGAGIGLGVGEGVNYLSDMASNAINGHQTTHVGIGAAFSDITSGRVGGNGPEARAGSVPDSVREMFTEIILSRTHGNQSEMARVIAALPANLREALSTLRVQIDPAHAVQAVQVAQNQAPVHVAQHAHRN